jgi:cysteine desulfurase
MSTIYMDHNATTPLDERVFEVMKPYLGELYGNASSLHQPGLKARDAVEKARDKVAALLGAQRREIYFNSGGTEGDNTAVKGVAFANQDKGKHIVTSSIEHSAVYKTCKYMEKLGFEVTYLPVSREAWVDPDDLRKAIRDDTILVSIMLANNEVGTIEPIPELAAIARERGIYIHTDAVQAIGKRQVDVSELGVDLLSISAHKFYGPKGTGALFVRKGVKFDSLLQGGGHEMRKRAGTENVAGIVGMGRAAELAVQELDEEVAHVERLRDRLQKGFFEEIDDLLLCGHPTERLVNTLGICVKHVEGEAMLLNLDLEGICCSTGSACSSGSLEPSHVLLAMGYPHEVAHGSLRFSLGKGNTEEEVDRVIEVLTGIVKKLRAMSPFASENA